jgi:hypothetical protein
VHFYQLSLAALFEDCALDRSGTIAIAGANVEVNETCDGIAVVVGADLFLVNDALSVDLVCSIERPLFFSECDRETVSLSGCCLELVAEREG